MAYIELIEEEDKIMEFSLSEELGLKSLEDFAALELVIELNSGSIDNLTIRTDNIFVERKEGEKVFIHMINSSEKEDFMQILLGEEAEGLEIIIKLDRIYDREGKLYKGPELRQAYIREEGNDFLFQGPYITGIEEGREIGDLLSKNPNIEEILNVDGSIPGDEDYVKTGMKVVIDNRDFWIFIKGDVNGDGKVDKEDIKSLQKHLLEEALLTYSYFMAGDMDGNSRINAMDIAYLQRLIYESSP